ncbi:MAG: DNA/RNA non-specific endonuclease, partial [Alistipes sp.]|nr:DNA/RNA non-specific endonuclease [Alistipes sp.]
YQLDADELQCVGFWLENRAYSGTTLTSVMTSVAEIETTTGMKFFEHVPQAPKAVLDKSAWKF